MSKELDHQLLTILKNVCENVYHRPTAFSPESLETMTHSTILDISHSLNNLQRDGFIRIHVGRPGEMSKVELLK